MQKISGYIIEKYNNMADAYTCRRMKEEAEKRGISIRILGVCDSSITADGIFNLGSKLEARDFLINRYKGGNIKSQINTLVKRQYNEHDIFSRYVNKYNQVKDLKLSCCIIPDYILTTLATNYQEIVSALGSPFVMKGLEGSQGNEVFLISNEGEYAEYREKWKTTKEWLMERFIESSYGRDIRFYSIRGEVIACMTREAVSGFKANVALGAEVRKLEISEDIRQTAKEIYQQTQLDFLGIDLLFGEEKPYFCEINVMPGIEGMERATGVNVAGCIIDTIAEDFER